MRIPLFSPCQTFIGRTLARKLSGNDSRLMVVRPGSSVSIKVDAVDGVNKSEIEAGLKQAIEKAGWKVVGNADIEVFAKIERGKKETLHFRTLGASFREPHETVTMKPFTASMEIRKGADVLWSRRSTNMVPSLIRLEAGETLKQAVKRFEKADPAYFERLTIPPKILRPEVSKMVGRSRIANGKWVDYFPASR